MAEDLEVEETMVMMAIVEAEAVEIITSKKVDTVEEEEAETEKVIEAEV